MNNLTINTNDDEIDDSVKIFTCELCRCCIHEKAIHQDHIDNKRCEILKQATKIKGMPDEWSYETFSTGFGKFSEPVCSQYHEWDWGTSDNWNEPTDFDLPYVSRDPNQLSIPFAQCVTN